MTLSQLANLTQARLFDSHVSISMGFNRHIPRYYYSVNNEMHSLLKQSLSLPLRTAFLTNLDELLTLTNDRIEKTTSQIEKWQKAIHSLTQWNEEAKELAVTLVALQTKNSQALPELPTDILWNIFITAAENSKTTASALSRVSKEVQLWVDPFLFRNISFAYHRNTPTEFSEAIKASRRLLQAVSSMTVVHISRRYDVPITHNMDEYIEILSQLPSFRSLSLQHARIVRGALHTWDVEIPTLRHLLWEADPNPSFPLPLRLCSSVTHLALHFPSRNPNNYDWNAISTLKTLCVLAVDVMDSGPASTLKHLHGKDYIQAGIARIQCITDRLTNPTVHTILWREWFSADNAQEFKDCVTMVNDKRLIICVAKLPPLARLVNGGLWPFLELNSFDHFWSLGLQDHVRKLRMTKKNRPGFASMSTGQRVWKTAIARCISKLT
ncbi:hypothetical protein DL96DRAFT_1615348 [Flagelloscypha sp. PMI_526]|nr:hypothetical protein DL96DRAFT_1615348 [Flagelloscypha sp. PMI_526]